MIPAIIGTRIGMTSIIGDKGRSVPVTVLKAGPCVVLQVKDAAHDGYDAVQLGYEDVKPHRSTKPIIGHCGKAGTGPKRITREIRLSAKASVKPGDVLTVEQFAEGAVPFVDIVGTTKGKGFAGTMKRHHFGGMESSHGVERKHRSAGSIGGHAPGASGRGIKKGKRMAGHLGHVRRTSSSLPVLGVDVEKDLLLIRGSVAGANGGHLVVRRSKKGVS